ncbi:MAG: BrnA antitoxin family protein [Propionibacteriaceae bacterium]|jgi:predicted DNA binding CopG/RHH family protein|nr:BrnA antitoxin family protein [Propionibacteriaceae bacterium]
MAIDMREEYDFSSSRPNPYMEKLRRPVTIRLDVATIDYFKAQSAQTGIPYQTLINFYLADCVTTKRKPTLTWHE